MEPYLILASVIAVLAALAAASQTWGVDSRDSIGDQHQEAVKRRGNW